MASEREERRGEEEDPPRSRFTGKQRGEEAPQMAFRLKVGPHTSGGGGIDEKNPVPIKHYNANDPNNNTVMSDLPLDQIYPEKFERIRAPMGGKSGVRQPQTRSSAPFSFEQTQEVNKGAQGALTASSQVAEQQRTERDQTRSEEEDPFARPPGMKSGPGPQDEVQGGEAQEDPALEELTVPQLRKMASDEGVDLGDATRKDDIIAAIRASRGE